MRKTIALKVREFKREQNREFYETIQDVLEHSIVNKMKDYPQHFGTDCYQHCLNVAYANFQICKILHWNAKEAARAGMIHDLFLYDWHTCKKITGNRFHGLTHPRHALKMAMQYFTLSKLEKDIILNHMWPITVSMPKSKEAYVTAFTDKMIGLFESWDYYSKKILPQRPHTIKWLWNLYLESK